MMNKRKIAILVATIAIVLGFGSMYYVRANSKKQEAQQMNHLTPVTVGRVSLGSIGKYEKYTGKTRGGEEEQIAPSMPANILSLNVAEGDEIEAGDVLMTLDSKDVDEQVQKSKEAYDKATEAVEQSKAQFQELEVKLTNLENEIASTKSLIEGNTKRITELQLSLKALELQLENEEISQEDYDKKKSEISKEILQKTNEVTESTKKLTQDEITKATLEKTLESSGSMNSTEGLDQLKAVYDAALKAKENYTIKATISGKVKGLNVREGEPAMSLMGPAMVISNTSTIDFDIQVGKDSLEKFVQGQKVKVNIDSEVGIMETEGIIEKISDQPDKKTNQYIVTVSVDNKDNEIVVGGYGSVLIEKSVKDDILVIHKNSVVREDGKTYVYKMEGNTAYKTEVELGEEDNDNVEVISGLEDGDSIVAKGKDFITDEEEVNVVRGSK